MKRFLIAIGAALALPMSASAHVTVFVEHHEDKPLEQTLSLPNIVALWAANGFLYKPGQVDYLTFTAEEGDQFLGFTFNPLKSGAREFEPNFALIGPGLPAVTGEVPFEVPEGAGAMIFTPAGEREISEEQLGYGALLEGEARGVALPAAGRYYVAVWHPEGKLGHYILSIGESEDETLVPDIEKYTIPRFGDLTDDGQVTDEDARLILQAVVGKINLTARQRFAADTGPAGDPANQISPGNGIVDVGDASRILRRALGMAAGDTWPF